MSIEQEISQERSRKQKGAAITIGVHLLLLVFFWFYTIWQAPDPPLPEYGIEINYGTALAGSGHTPPESPEPTKVEELSPEIEEVAEEIPEETITEETVAPTEVDNPMESPVVEKKTEEKPEKTEKKPLPKKDPVKKVTPKKKPVKKPEPEKPKKEGFKFSPKKGNTSGREGDDKNASGDKGQTDGKNQKGTTYTGKSGGGGGGNGSNISMDGWNVVGKMNPKDNSSENGKLRFKVTIDDQGDIISVVAKEMGVSSSVMKIYRAEVYKLSFIRKSGSGEAPPTSVGYVTFSIRSK